MKNFHKLIIVGAGPVGLYFATKCETANLDYIILEATDVVGGQIAHLYPKKEIVDIPGIDSIVAIDFIHKLEKEIDFKKIVFNSTVSEIKNGEIIEISAGKTTYFCEKLIIATGLGMAAPRPLGVEHESDCCNIIYSLHDYDFLKGKRVAIFGGGDSALDWAKCLSKFSDDVHLIHRRTEFRGNPDTIKDCSNLNIHLPFVPFSIDFDGEKAKSITINKVDEEGCSLTIPVDYIFVNFGNVAKQNNFNFNKMGTFLIVDEFNRVENNIYAIGDGCQHENKTRRIAPGIKEAEIVFKQIID